jgi:hypothetical protein
MPFNALTAVFGLAGCLLLIAAVRRLRVGRVAGAVFESLSALALFLLAACTFLVGVDLRTYQRLTAEQPAGELEFSKIAAHQFNGVLTYPDGQVALFFLRGDEWQVDARILKWQALANLVGFDTVFRLDRISGRYTQIEDERREPRTVYQLNPSKPIDLWQLARSYPTWIPWFDALYGSATFLPMADKADFEISVSQSGLIARPLNQAARDAVRGWH